MTPEQFEEAHGVLLVRKDEDALMRLIGRLWSAWMTRWWTTYRRPFGRPRICYPVTVGDPMHHMGILHHELVHVQQMRSWWGLLGCALLVSVLPLPVLLSGRWYLERPAYLLDIRTKRMRVDEAVEALWVGYVWPWPRAWMRRWFRRQLARADPW